MLRRFIKRFSRRQMALLCLVVLIEGAALAGGVFGFEAAAWAGLMVANLALLLMLFTLSHRLANLAAIERQRLRKAAVPAVEPPPSDKPEPDDERTELLMRRLLAAFERERRLNARRFEQLARSDGAAEEYDPA